MREVGHEQVDEGWRKQEDSYSGQEYWCGMFALLLLSANPSLRFLSRYPLVSYPMANTSPPVHAKKLLNGETSTKHPSQLPI